MSSAAFFEVTDPPYRIRTLSDTFVPKVVFKSLQKTACGIVGGFMEDIFGKELKPWQESEKPGMEP